MYVVSCSSRPPSPRLVHPLPLLTAPRCRAVSLDLGVLAINGLLAEKLRLREAMLVGSALAAVSRRHFDAAVDRYCDPAGSSRKGQVGLGVREVEMPRRAGTVPPETAFSS